MIGHEAGKGRLHSTLGALLVREECGCEFKIGSGFDDKQRENPPEIGSVVTFKFQGRTHKGVPRFPIFLREYIKN